MKENRFTKILDDLGIDYSPITTKDVAILCPFHLDSNPSLQVSLEHGGFICRSCHERGNFVKLIAKLADLEYETAFSLIKKNTPLDIIVEQLSREFEDREQEEEDKFIDYKTFSKTFPSVDEIPEAVAYLEGRGIFDHLLYDQFDLRFGVVGRYANRIVLPICDREGCLISFTARSIFSGVVPKTKKAKSHPIKTTLYGLYELLQDRKTSKLPYVVLVEGEFDCLYLQQYGICALSTMGTSELSDAQKALLLSTTNKIYICYDSDKAGWAALERDRHQLAKQASVEAICLPDSKDPDDLSYEELLYYFKGVI
jgi:DNA primase